MSFEVGSRNFDVAQRDSAYLRRRVREEADAAVGAHSLAATLIHVSMATAYAKRCCDADDRAWVANNRLW